ncbi:MAG: CRISPR-associated endonuclease Cas2 [Lachnospiraceae bacterium]|nr:CRISPR-associated endonuclease Cas2 [Lachnospiraceae bacterium]
MKAWYTVVYDISSDKVRRKAEKVCSSYMQRIQYSVFEGYMTEANAKAFWKGIGEVTLLSGWDEQTDSILMYRHCSGCYQSRERIGKKIDLSKSYYVI